MKKGEIKDRVGEVNYNNFGSKMKIIRCNRCDDIDIYFPEYDWTAKNKRYNHFKKGLIKCPYEKRTYEVGYLGEGKYLPCVDGVSTKEYDLWKNLLKRCYYEKEQIKHPTYKDVTVCDEWHNFQNFAEWYHNNYYEIEGEKMSLDKDILIKGNKIYSSQTCIFTPQRINNLFVKCDKNRGIYPIGVIKCNNKYKARCNNINLGSFNTPHEAFLMYKLNKELSIQSIAEEYKYKIPNKLYNALINYKVEEND